jgi:hypothetical protein
MFELVIVASNKEKVANAGVAAASSIIKMWQKNLLITKNPNMNAG